MDDDDTTRPHGRVQAGGGRPAGEHWSPLGACRQGAGHSALDAAQPASARVQAREAAAPDQVWVRDLTYVATDEGWLHVAAILDLFSRKRLSPRRRGWAAGQCGTACAPSVSVVWRLPCGNRGRRGESWRSAPPLCVAGLASWQAAWFAPWRSSASKASPAPVGGAPTRPRRSSAWSAKPVAGAARWPRWRAAMACAPA